MPTAAPISVLMKLTTSFVIHPPCIVAPMSDSMFVATNAAIRHGTTADAPTRPMATA